ncbi:ATP dependent DNA ligase domain-containing protein [Seiridium cupressi]
MPFPFRYICDLLQRLEDDHHSKGKQKSSSKNIIRGWFHEHRELLDAPSTDAVAILSTLFPEKRADRVYGIKVAKLENIISKAIILGGTRLELLREYKKPGLNKDLADCVEQVLRGAPNPIQKVEVTVEEVDEALHCIATSSRFSSEAVQTSRAGTEKANATELYPFFQRLTARDAKWLTRLILRNFAPVELDGRVVCQAYDPRLPQLLAVRDDFVAAASLLRDRNAAVKPESLIKIGVKVGRQPWHKARSLKHCADMVGKKEVSCEQKIDGEYCQIHIDLSKPSSQQIQIFSKSGRDSTMDRVKVHRSGSFLGTTGDVRSKFYEHPMIIYYDILLIDDDSLLNTRQSDRFRRLESLITPREGHAALVQRQMIDFRKRDAAKQLEDVFVKSSLAREEGLVLKPNDSYVDFGSGSKHYASCAIKLKMAYLEGMGDVGDFAVIGASYDATRAKELKIEGLKYTHFFVACLQNPKQATAERAKPSYIVTNVVTLNGALSKYFKIYCNPPAVPLSENTYSVLDFRGLGTPDRPKDIFPDPPVFDVYSFSFDKPPNSGMWTMRFPQVSKIHLDRSYLGVLSSEKLQEAALNATKAPQMEDSQENSSLLSRIRRADPGRKSADYDSQATASPVSTVSATTSMRSTEDETQEYGIRSPRFGHTPAMPDSKRGLITPPRSTIVNVVGAADAAGNVSANQSTDTSSGNRKRTIQAMKDPSPSKKAKIPSISTTASATKRKPLGARDANDSQRSTRSTRSRRSESPLPTLGEIETTPPTEGYLPSSVNGSFHTANETSSSPLRRTPRKKKNAEVEPVDSTKDRTPRAVHGCGRVGSESKCAFVNCSFLLAPCISNYAWTQDLLRGHGILNFAVDPATWEIPSLSGVSSAKSSPRSRGSIPGWANGEKNTRVRKICLVEVRRPGATDEFMKKIEAAKLTRSNGKRDWVSVYDWRILEDITSMESGVASKGPECWRSRYVGIA